MTIDRLRLDELIALARGRGASDLHAGGGEPPMLRLDGRIVALDVPPIAGEAVRGYVEATLSPDGVRRLTTHGSADAGVRSGAAAPYRLHVYRTATGLRVALRFLHAALPSLDSLALPSIVASFAARPNGLVLFTGPTGSGKTTALAALIDRMNRSAARAIVTVEDPVEYVHRPIRSLVAQCEIGSDVANEAEAVRGFMRADPDVILIGEMRDRATMEAALGAAETGHLVLSTLHTGDAVQTVDRIVDAFPGAVHAQVRAQLAATLIAVVSLRLVPARAGGRVAACEILVASDAVRAIVREGKTHQLRTTIVTGRAAGMQTLEAHLSDLVVNGTIDVADARAAANRPADVRELERMAG